MELSYRGVNFDYAPGSTAVSLGKVGGKYRGCDWRFRHLTQAPVLSTNLDLIYRGVAYQTQPAPAPAPVHAGVSDAVIHPEPALSVDQRARLMMMNHHRWIKNRQQSMLGRGSEEIGFKPANGSYWTPIQGKVQPSFWASYDRSRAALS